MTRLFDSRFYSFIRMIGVLLRGNGCFSAFAAMGTRGQYTEESFKLEKNTYRIIKNTHRIVTVDTLNIVHRVNCNLSITL